MLTKTQDILKKLAPLTHKLCVDTEKKVLITINKEVTTQLKIHCPDGIKEEYIKILNPEEIKRDDCHEIKYMNHPSTHVKNVIETQGYGSKDLNKKNIKTLYNILRGFKLITPKVRGDLGAYMGFTENTFSLSTTSYEAQLTQSGLNDSEGWELIRHLNINSYDGTYPLKVGVTVSKILEILKVWSLIDTLQIIILPDGEYLSNPIQFKFSNPELIITAILAPRQTEED